VIDHILIVCVGNICRSPVAEGLFKARLANIVPAVSISSAGLGALVDRPASAISQELMRANGLDISAHRARQISSAIVFKAELILTMTTDQEQEIARLFPATKGRIHRLGKWGGFDVPDPFQRPKVIYEQAFALMEQGVDEWCKKLWN
jgi:protein-tyrosine phosphatase